MSYSRYTRCLSFQDCEDALGRTKVNRKVANNTYLSRLDANTFRITLHFTDVVLIHRDGTYTLNSGGYQTHTTKTRLNTFAPVTLFQKNWNWYIQPYCDWKGQVKVPYTDGIKIDGYGAPVV